MLHHSDRGSQYASRDYQALLSAHQMVCSTSRKGDCYDNAMMESFFSTLKSEWRRWSLRHEGTSSPDHLRVHRGVVQSRAAPLGSRLPKPRSFRAGLHPVILRVY